MLESVVTLYLMVQTAKCRGMWQLWVQGGGWGHDVSLGQATGVHSTDNCVVLGEHSGVSAMATRAIGVIVVPPGPEATYKGRQQWHGAGGGV